MYVFTDASVIETLGRTIVSFARINENIIIGAFARELKFTSINASRTVDAHMSFTPPAFTGSGGLQAARIKAKAAESIFGRLEQDKVREISIRVLRDRVDIKFESHKNGIVRVYRLDCLNNGQVNLDPPEPLESKYGFACSLSTFRGILSHCMPGADEAELRIDGSGEIGFHAHKLRPPRRKNAAIPGSMVDLSGATGRSVTTSIHMAVSQFEELKVDTPWAVKFRLKEFRVLISNFLDKNDVVIAQFSRPSEPLYFVGSSTGYQYCFRFTTQRSSRLSSHRRGQLNVGGYEAVPATALASLLSSDSSSFANYPPAPPSRRQLIDESPDFEPRRPARRTPVEEEPSATSSTEVGMTQHEVVPRGLFD